MGSPPPTDTDVATATGKQTLATHGMPTPCRQVKFAPLPFFPSSVGQWRREQYAAVIHDTGQASSKHTDVWHCVSVQQNADSCDTSADASLCTHTEPYYRLL